MVQTFFFCFLRSNVFTFCLDAKSNKKIKAEEKKLKFSSLAKMK